MLTYGLIHAWMRILIAEVSNWLSLAMKDLNIVLKFQKAVSFYR
jgi:hypothetical protein